jgi:cytochrome c oxidase cbb3-type subunit 3
MPAFGEFLGDAKVHLLTAYVYGFGGGEASTAGTQVVAPSDASPVAEAK